jgi:hypothetical protein
MSRCAVAGLSHDCQLRKAQAFSRKRTFLASTPRDNCLSCALTPHTHYLLIPQRARAGSINPEAKQAVDAIDKMLGIATGKSCTTRLSAGVAVLARAPGTLATPSYPQACLIIRFRVRAYNLHSAIKLARTCTACRRTPSIKLCTIFCVHPIAPLVST